MSDLIEHDTSIRTRMVDAAIIVADCLRDGMPLVTWTLHPHVSCGLATLTGYAAGEPETVSAIVDAYAARLGVEPHIKAIAEHTSVHAHGFLRGVHVEVWGVIEYHEAGQ